MSLLDIALTKYTETKNLLSDKRKIDYIYLESYIKKLKNVERIKEETKNDIARKI